MACRWCLTNDKQRRIGQWSNMPAENLHLHPANGNQRAAELTANKKIIVTKYTQIT